MCHRRVGRDHWTWHSHWSNRRRTAALPLLVGFHIPGQRSDRRNRIPRCSARRADIEEPRTFRPDSVGAILSILGLGLLLWAIIEAPTKGWTSPRCDRGWSRQHRPARSFRGREHRSRHPMLNSSCLGAAVLHCSLGRGARDLRVAGSVVSADPVPSVQTGRFTPPGWGTNPTDGRHAGRQRCTVSNHFPFYRGQTDRLHRPRRCRWRFVADLFGVFGGNDLWGCPSGFGDARLGGWPSHTAWPRLVVGSIPQGRLRGGVSDPTQ